jgi:hypothetical protein
LTPRERPSYQRPSPQTGRAREATILLALARRPEIASRWVDEIAEAEIASADLDAARTALISAALSADGVGADAALIEALERAAPGAAVGFARPGAPLEWVERGLAETLSRHAAASAHLREVREAEAALREAPGAEVDGRLRQVTDLHHRDFPGAVKEDDREADLREGFRASLAVSESLLARPKKRRVGPNH